MDYRILALAKGRGGGALARLVLAPLKYGWWLGCQVIARLCLFLLAIEAIFIAEKIESVLGFASRYATPWTDVLLLLMYAGPEVADLALPIALLTACYVVFLKSREQRELIALANAGVGARQIVAFCLMVGFSLQLCSLLISGSLEPHARFAYRETEYESRVRALVDTAGPGHFHLLGKYVVLMGSAQPSGAGGVFVREDLGGGSSRVTAARTANLGASEGRRKVIVRLTDVQEVEIRPKPNPKSQSASAATDQTASGACCSERDYTLSDRLKMSRYSRQIALDDFIKLAPRGVVPAEWTFGDLLNRLHSQQPIDAGLSGETARRFVRSLLCLIGPLLAVLAVGFANRSTQALALPAASALLMGLDIAGTSIVKAFAPSGLPLISVFLGAGIIGALLMWQTAAKAHSLVAPAIARA